MKRILPLILIALTAFSDHVQAFRMTTRYAQENGKMIVRASINGVEGRFVLDTGAPCSLTFSYAKRAGLKGGQVSRAYDSNGNIVNTTILDLPQLVVGGVAFTQLQAMQLPQGNMIEQFGIDGILGYNLLRQGIVKFDGRAQTMTLTSDTTGLGIDLNMGILLTDDPYSTMIPLRMGQSVDTVMFDTGALDLYEMSNRFYERVKADTAHFRCIASGKGILSMGAAGLESASVKHRIVVPQAFLGNTALSRLSTITTDAIDSRIGSNLLRHGDVIIDYREGIFYFQPYASTTVPIDAYQPEWNVVVTVMGDHLEAGMVWNNAGGSIQSGDRIVAIGDERIDKVDMRKATTQAIFQMHPEGTEITFVNGRSGKEETMTISMN